MYCRNLLQIYFSIITILVCTLSFSFGQSKYYKIDRSTGKIIKPKISKKVSKEW